MHATGCGTTRLPGAPSGADRWGVGPACRLWVHLERVRCAVQRCSASTECKLQLESCWAAALRPLLHHPCSWPPHPRSCPLPLLPQSARLQGRRHPRAGQPPQPPSFVPTSPLGEAPPAPQGIPAPPSEPFFPSSHPSGTPCRPDPKCPFPCPVCQTRPPVTPPTSPCPTPLHESRILARSGTFLTIPCEAP